MEIRFGLNGNDTQYLVSGWSGDEPGIRWMIDQRSRIALPNIHKNAIVALELECNPFVVDRLCPVQRLAVEINDGLVGVIALGDGGLFAFPFSTGEVTDLNITFYHPDCRRPRDLINSTDGRNLAIAMVKLRLLAEGPKTTLPSVSSLMLSYCDPISSLSIDYGIEADQLVGRFENFGHDCEFGLFQRRMGAEPIGLFRFAEIRIRDAVRGLDEQFCNISRAEDLSALTYADGGDYHIHHLTYKFRYHTHIYPNEISAKELCEKHARLLHFGRRALLERITGAERIYVVKHNKDIADAEAMALFLAIRRIGNAPVLYVVQCDANHPAGTVERLSCGLLKGYVTNFWDGGNLSISSRHWLEICLNTVMLLDEH